MEFENDVHRETHAKLESYLDELFDDPHHDPGNGHFYVRFGSTVLEISDDPYGQDDALVTIMSYCVQGIERDEDLFVALLELNHRLPLGAFSLVGDDVFFSYTLSGRSLSPPNLLAAVEAVATVADEYDDRIVARYGGKRALDRIRDTGGRKRRTKRAGG